jgi:hypothetical protein
VGVFGFPRRELKYGRGSRNGPRGADIPEEAVTYKHIRLGGRGLFPATPGAVGEKSVAKTQIPEGFSISADMRAWAESKTPTVNIDTEHESFCDYWRAHGTKMADWTATWRNWMRRAPKMGGAVYSPEEVEVRALMREYTAKGFRRAYVHETAFKYRQAFEAVEREKLPKRDMSSVLQLVASKRA